MSTPLHEALADTSLLAKAIVGYYAARYRKKEDGIVRTLIGHFARNDQDYDPAQFGSELPTEPDAKAAFILAHYASRYRRPMAKVLHVIVVQFAKTDQDFDADELLTQNETPGLSEALKDAGLVKAPPPPPPIPRCPMHDAMPMPQREAVDHRALSEVYEEKVSTYRCPHADSGTTEKALRGVHPKTHGVVESSFRILKAGEVSSIGLPVVGTDDRVGLFKAEGESFPGLLRFSGGGGLEAKVLSDQERLQPHGLAIKLLSSSGETLHDFLFNNTPIFFTREAVQAVPKSPAEVPQELLQNFESLIALGDTSPETLTLQQWSMSAYSWGHDRAVKYAVRPTNPVQSCLNEDAKAKYDAILASGTANYRREALHFALRHLQTPLELAFCVQFADPNDAESMGCPVDNEAVLWKTPLFHLATLSIEAQEPFELREPRVAEALSFNSWHISHETHLPLGRLNRARFWVYAHTAAARQRLNAVDAPYAYQAPSSLKVAIVGGGAAGCAAALALAEFGYRVTLFERNSELGGHACSKEVFDGAHRREPAFGAFRKRQWPNLMAVLDLLNVESESHGSAENFLESSFVGWFDEAGDPVLRSEAVLDASQTLLKEFARALKDPEADAVTVGECVDQLGLDAEFLATYFLGGVVHYFAGHPIEYYLDYPLRLLAWMWLNNAAREDDEPVELLKVDNRVYMARFESLLVSKGVSIRKNVMAQVTRRNDAGFQVTYPDSSGEKVQEEFGKMVFAVLPHHAISVLGACVHEQEQAVLSRFTHTVDTVVVHRDESWMPRERDAWKLFNVRLERSGGRWPARAETAPITIEKHCTKDHQTPIFATYDYAHSAEERFAGPVERFTFEHARVTVDTQRHRVALAKLQGVGGAYFCGSWSRGLTLHEDALVSAFEIANQILGPVREYRVLQPPVPLPTPFEAWNPASKGKHGAGWDSREAALAGLQELLAVVADRADVVTLHEEQSIRSLGLSSLHLARWTSVINDQLPSYRDPLDLSMLFEVETVGDLLDEIMGEGVRGLVPDMAGPGAPSEDESPRVKDGPRLREERTGEAALEGVLHPVAYAQETILLSHFLAGKQAGDWNIPLARWLEGPLSEKALRQAFDWIAQRHPMLRATFRPQADGTFGQMIQAALPDAFFSMTSVSSDAEAERLAREAFRVPMRLKKEVFRVRVYRVSPERHLLVAVAHHAVMDGWSVGLLLRELQAFYGALDGGKEIGVDSLPMPSLSFADFAHWQRTIHEAHHDRESMLYWRRQLSGLLPVLNLLSELAEAPSGKVTAHTVSVLLNPELVSGLKALSAQLKTSHNVVLLTAYAAFLGHLSGQGNLLVRLPHAARPHGTEGVLGCFADAMVLPVGVAPQETVAAAVGRIHTTFYGALEHALPFALFPQVLTNPQELLPLLNRAVLNVEQGVGFVDMDTSLGERMATSDFALQQNVNIDASAVHSMLSLNEFPDQSMRGDWQFSAAIFLPESSEQLGAAFVTWLLAIVSHDGKCTPGEMLSEVSLRTPEDDFEVDSDDLFGDDE